jgi:hypothetical protein
VAGGNQRRVSQRTMCVTESTANGCMSSARERVRESASSDYRHKPPESHACDHGSKCSHGIPCQARTLGLTEFCAVGAGSGRIQRRSPILFPFTKRCSV